MKEVKLAYYDEFSCIGPECTDTCCKHWSIDVSKREYLDYKKMKCSPKLRSAVESAFKRYKDGSDFRYAKMKLREDGSCHFLDGDDLCMLQKEIGESALCFTCRIFPRMYYHVGREAVIRSCFATCSHVTEILMDHPEGLAITEDDYDGKDPFLNAGKETAAGIDEDWEGYSCFWDILTAEIDILQNRDFSVSERMLILGYFCEKADEYISGGRTEKVADLASMLFDNELCRKIADSLKPTQSEDAAARKTLYIMSRMNARAGNMSPEYVEPFADLFERVNASVEFAVETKDGRVTEIKVNREKYNKLTGIYRQIENDRPYITENLLVNLVFSQDFTKGIWANYLCLAIFYNTLKIFAPAFLPENWNDRDLACALTYAVKMTLNSNLAQVGAEDFKKDNTYTLPYAALLIC